MHAMSDAAHSTRENYLEQNVRIFASPGFPDWLAAQRMTLLGAARDRNMLFCMGTDTDGQFNLYDRLFEGCSGLFRQGDHVYVAGRDRIWHLQDFKSEKTGAGGVFHPKVLHYIGNVAAHELIEDHLGRIVFANTQYSCLSAIAPGAASFEPMWAPSFAPAIESADACHLNGIGRDAAGVVRWVTGCGTTSDNAGWRQMRMGGGWLIDRISGDTMASGLSMPHSPREHAGSLYVLSSGAGYFGRIDRDKGIFEPLVLCPGFARGMVFVGSYAVIGLSKPRGSAFSGLPLDEALARYRVPPRCGWMVIDLNTMKPVHTLYLEGTVSEIQDVCAIKGHPLAMIHNYETAQSRNAIEVGPWDRRV